MKKLLLTAFAWALSIAPSYGNFPSPEQMIEFCTQNPQACSQQQGPTTAPVDPTVAMSDPSIAQAQPAINDPAVSYLVPQQQFLNRAPNFEGLEYQAPNADSVATYYQIQNQILQNQVRQMQWQEQQRMLKSSIDGMTSTFQNFIKREEESNKAFQQQYLEMQQNFFLNFQKQQAAVFAPFFEQQKQFQEMQIKNQEVIKQLQGDDQIAGSEEREGAEDKTEEITEKEIEEKLKQNNVIEG